MKSLKIAVSCLIIVFLTTMLYIEHFDNSFHFDDSHTILENQWIRNTENIPSFFKSPEPFSSLPQNQMYRPLITTSLSIDYALSARFHDGNGYHPFFYHLDSFLWFLLVILLLYYLSYKLLVQHFSGKFAWLIATLASLSFAVHGAMAETVNYVIARSDIVSTAGVLGGLAVYVAFPRLRKFQVFLLPVILGMLAKSTTAMFYPVFLTWLILFESEFSLWGFIRGLFSAKPLGKTARRVFLKSVPTLIVIAAAGIFSLVYMRADSFYPSAFSKFEYAITQPWVILHYLLTFLAPLHLSADSDWTILNGITDPRFIAGIIFIILFVFSIFRFSRIKTTRMISFGLAFFLFTLIPTSSIVPLAEVLNDHRIFLPFTGLCIALASMINIFVFQALKGKNKSLVLLVGAALFGAWIVFNSITVLNRNEVWNTDKSLWADVVVKSPRNGRGQMNYALTLMAEANYDEALSYLKKAEKLTPGYPYVHVNLGICYNAMNQGDAASRHFELALNYGPNMHFVHFYHARNLTYHNKLAEANYHLKRCLQLSPGYLPAQELLLTNYSTLSAWDYVNRMAEKILVINPTNALALHWKEQTNGLNSLVSERIQALHESSTKEDYLDISLQLYFLGEFETCIEACQNALKIDPQYAEAYNNICSAYNAMRNYAMAKQACEAALQINSEFELAKNNLAFAKKQMSTEY